MALRESTRLCTGFNRVVNNLLNMTRLEAVRVQPRLDWCDVTELCAAAVDLVGDTLADHRLERDIQANLPLVKMDQALIEQALANLLVNAAMHTPPGTEVILRAYLENGRLHLTVLDRGPACLETMSNRFSQNLRAALLPQPAAPACLAIARGFARAHGGDAIARQRDGGGAEFTIVLPVEILDTSTHESSLAHRTHH